MALQVTQEQVDAFRLHRSFLIPSNTSPVTVASKLAGIQAQVFSAAKLSLGLRSNATAGEIEKYFSKPNGIVKTWAMRGTLYALAASDLSLFCAAFGSDATERYLRHWKRLYDINEKSSEQLIEAIGDSLSLTPKTRKQIALEVCSVLGDWTKPLIENGWGGAVKYHCELGNAVFSEVKGTETSFVRRERYVKQWKEYSANEAHDEILRRYLAAFGPSNPSDFGYWLGRKMPLIRDTWSRIEPEMLSVEYGGKKGFILKKDKVTIQNIEPVTESLRLLPFFDVYLLAHRKKEHLVADKHYKKIYRNAGWISETLLMNGKAKGIWEAEEKKHLINIRIKPFEKLTSDTKELLVEEKLRLEHYFGKTIRFRFR
jgi:hypothetical protein